MFALAASATDSDICYTRNVYRFELFDQNLAYAIKVLHADTKEHPVQNHEPVDDLKVSGIAKLKLLHKST